MVRLAAIALALAAAGIAMPALATQQGTLVIKNWNLMDKCNREAQAAFPDYSVDAYAKRDAKLKACLAGQDLPPRNPIAPGK